MNFSLMPQCALCGAKGSLLRCAGCKVTLYCTREHQVADRDAHKAACNGVKKAQQVMDTEERKLRAHPGDFMTPANVFDEGIGHFWGIHETRPYGVVEALLNFDTCGAVQAALDHVMDMLRLSRGDNMGVRDLVPGLLLRLGKDQECYDFCKWYATTGQRGDYDWGDMDLGYLDVKDADAFESTELWTREYLDLSHTIGVTLMKFRLLLDARALQNGNLLGEKLPQELLDNIRRQLVSTVVAGKRDIVESKDQTQLIQKLESQVEELFVAVKDSNKYLWPALLNPGPSLKARPAAFSHGTREQMVLVLQYNYRSWIETPGAIDMIRGLFQKY